MDFELLAALRPVLAAFERLGVACHIGGSVASSSHGVGRSTQDVDVIADLHPSHVRPLVAALANDYYVSEPMIEAAIRGRSCFNVIHLPSMFKVDIFVLKQRPFDQAAFRRAKPGRVGLNEDFVETAIASPEDVVLNKLEWFRLGDELSERQWNDVLGVLKVCASNLDHAYLDRWANELGVRDLLDRARAEVNQKQTD